MFPAETNSGMKRDWRKTGHRRFQRQKCFSQSRVAHSVGFRARLATKRNR